MSYRIPATTLFLLLALFLSVHASDQPVNLNSHSGEIPTLDQVTVIGHTENSLTGQSGLSHSLIKSLPQKDSSISEIINLLPRVQIGEGQKTSENAGEILPPHISISGGRAYENNFSIDGVGINSILDPLASNESAIDQVPGHPQRSFIHLDLLEDITVYDSNIPAKYGKFVGGVIDARTRMPKDDFGGAISMRTTNDSWTDVHIDNENKEDFYHSDSFNQQPVFTKYDGSLTLDIPLNETMGLLTSYNRIQSDLEFFHLEDWTEQKKRLESFFMKYAWAPERPYTLEISTAFTPSEEDFFLKNVAKSDFNIKRGGHSINGLLKGETELGRYELTAAYLQNENSRSAPMDFFSWKDTASKDTREGGFGDLDTTEESFQLHAGLDSNSFSVGKTRHTLNFGAEFTRDRGGYNRKETSTSYSFEKDDNVSCSEKDSTCITGEQYSDERRIYSAQQQTAEVNYLALYIDDQISVGPLEVRPGLRIAHDDFMNKTNVAPRLATSWDLFGNGATMLIGGINRYYGESLLTYKLREAINLTIKEVRSLDPQTNQPAEWSFNKTLGTLDKFSQLDSPYSDEKTIGLQQELFGGVFELNYLERENHDQFAKERRTEIVDGESTTSVYLNNNGSSEYESVKVLWDRQWQNHYLGVNYTYSDQQSSNENYDSTFDDGDLDEEIWFEGMAIQKWELPRQDFFRDHVFRAIYTGKLPGGFSFTNVTSYLGSYEAVQRVRLSDAEKVEDGIPEDLDVYEIVTQPDYWTFDWRVDWQTTINLRQLLTISLEVNNVFNRTPPAAGEDDIFERGRQFWVGVDYTF